MSVDFYRAFDRTAFPKKSEYFTFDIQVDVNLDKKKLILQMVRDHLDGIVNVKSESIKDGYHVTIDGYCLVEFDNIFDKLLEMLDELLGKEVCIIYELNGVQSSAIVCDGIVNPEK